MTHTHHYQIISYPRGAAHTKADFYDHDAGAVQRAQRHAKDCGEFVDVIKDDRVFAVVGEHGIVGPTGEYPQR